MKKIKLSLYLLFFFQIVFSQNNGFTCDYDIINANNKNTMTLYSCALSENYIRNKLTTLGSDFSNETPYVINVYYHINPVLQNDIDECMLIEKTAYLNNYFNQYQIYFNYTGYEIYQGITPSEETKLHIMINPYGNDFVGDSFGKIVHVSYFDFVNVSTVFFA